MATGIDDIGFIQLLGFFLWLHPTTFKDYNPPPSIAKFSGQNYSSGSPTHDANITLNDLVERQLAGVQYHR
jgi:hypothetical protein